MEEQDKVATPAEETKEATTPNNPPQVEQANQAQEIETLKQTLANQSTEISTLKSMVERLTRERDDAHNMFLNGQVETTQKSKLIDDIM